MQMIEATSRCQSLNASQILPKSRHESDDLASALLSLDLDSVNGKMLVSIDIHKTNEGFWYDSTGQLISYFNWAPDEPDDLGGNNNYAGFRIGGVNETARWADYRSTDQLNVVCTKIAGQGKNRILVTNRSYGNSVLKKLFENNFKWMPKAKKEI